MNKPILRRKSTWILSTLLVFVIVARIILPGLILKNLNDYLGSFSPLYSLHVEDLQFHLWQLAYSLENIEGKLKKKPSEFLELKHAHVALALREVFKGKFVVDVTLRELSLKVTTETLNALSGVSKDQAKQDAKNVKDATVPFDLERVTLHDSNFEFSDVAGLPPEQNFFLSHLEGMANNLTPKSKDGMSVFSATADVQGAAKIKAVGQFKSNLSPVDWSVNVILKDLTLSTLNPIARRMVPLTFKSGSLSLYLAAQSVQGKLLGYAKPFLKNMVLIGDKGDFKNVGQFFIEVGGTVGNFFLKNGKTHALAMKVAFRTGPNGKMETDTGKALKTAIDNSFGQSLPERLDETLELQ